ncbi:sodium-dependent transporter bedraggled isoform X2 [Choristoneura fumiferana]|uniref:sodium-dependent transporter bedraggled isoform X2 n=2 Tax=Choristoneura fumiferana TaxID=7141 RepID=UPI003D1571F9
MEVVNIDEGRYEQRENHMPSCSTTSNTSCSVSESNYSSEQSSDDLDKSDDEDLREDLQKTIPECYKSDSNITSQTSTDITNDEDFQATALCQFMDILNDLDEVLDKSLLACLDDGAKNYDSDEGDLICKIKECIGDAGRSIDSEMLSSLDDNAQVVTAGTSRSVHVNEASTQNIHEGLNHRRIEILGRSRSFAEVTGNNREALVPSLERAGTTNDNLRNSMRCLDPIVLPALATPESSEPLTLPVILFLEHHVNLRPTSAPIQLQVTAANLSSDGSSGPLILGRRALLMNRTLSLPSPGDSDATGEWPGRSPARSPAHSSSSSSDSSESLTGVTAAEQTAIAATEERNEETEEPPFGVWPHRMSAMLACLSCTVGIFNISRFAIFSVHFGANFLLQFFILSLLVGIPLFTLHLCLGQVLESGPVDMWRISPIFQGVGVSMLIAQAVMGIYSIIGLSWIFVYFRDSFITSNDKYKWALPHEYFNFEDSGARNASLKIHDTLPLYFHGEVLQKSTASNNSLGTIKFQVAFNLAVVWMIVFVSLSKGLRSYGKAVYVLIFLPICGTLVLCTKLLTLIPYDSFTNIFTETDWSEFFVDSNSWTAAAQETFLTWGLLGACVMQLTSHKNAKNKTSAMLQKESACIVSFTFAILLLSSFLANTCVQILKSYGYAYIPGSFETVQSSQFLWPTSEPMPGNTVSTPIRYRSHYASLVGITVWKTGSAVKSFSGWQPLQLATQIVPATLAVLPPNMLSPAWAVIFYFILIMFGIGQQLAIWHCVITGIMAINAEALRVWETTITFLSCVVGLGIGLLLTTDAGVRLVHFLDYVWVGSWVTCAVQVALTCGVFVVRGRPYSADTVVRALYAARGRLACTLATLLSFTWTVALPVLLCAISVMDFRAGQQRQLYTWRKHSGYWPVWVRQTAVAMQQTVLLAVPAAAFVQTWRYMSKGPPDILDRIQNLYRPHLGPAPAPPPPPRARSPAPPPDPPPKYTPPPSYSTATGARLLNTLRRSFRTLRRITSARTETLPRDDTSQLPITLSESVDRERSTASQPPNYSGVFSTPTITINNESERASRSSTSRNSLSLTRDYLRRSFVRKSDSAKSIRSSLRRSFKYGGALTTSHEQLVREAEPISNTVAMSAMLPASRSDSPL